jgi:hypothetical protein
MWQQAILNAMQCCLAFSILVASKGHSPPSSPQFPSLAAAAAASAAGGDIGTGAKRQQHYR